MKPHALAIAGPTASGKTGLALAIAAHLQEQLLKVPMMVKRLQDLLGHA